MDQLESVVSIAIESEFNLNSLDDPPLDNLQDVLINGLNRKESSRLNELYEASTFLDEPLDANTASVIIFY